MNLEEAWNAPGYKLFNKQPSEKVINKIQEEKKGINPQEEFEKLEKEEIRIVTINDDEYPIILKEIYTPPPILYVKGTIKEDEQENRIGVVGARKMTLYGKEVAIDLVSGLAQNNVTIVSGLARGIDSVAHRTSLENNTKTIAILGSNLSEKSIYPSENRGLAEKIVEDGGALVSEYSLRTPTLPQNFPQRNRIISGLSRGILVIEAGEKSGTLITAREALDQNREVFAVPGPVTSPNSIGTNNLIKLGAKPTTCVNDILEDLGIEIDADTKNKKEPTFDTEEEAQIFQILSKEPLHIDKIAQISKIDLPKLNSTLTMMEIKGVIRNLGSMQYIKNY